MMSNSRTAAVSYLALLLLVPSVHSRSLAASFSLMLVRSSAQGLIWFILPALLIISNDTWAYIFGFFFGRTPLIALSPKKTWSVQPLAV